jgi:Tol biopolymer transport system component
MSVFGLRAWNRNMAAGAEPSDTLAFASFGPLNTDQFTADADGRNPQPLVPHADHADNASFSHDGRWIVFTSHPNGSADGRSDRRAQGGSPMLRSITRMARRFLQVVFR